MLEVITCPSCRRKLQLPPALLGGKVQCPTCSRAFVANPTQEPPAAKAPAPPVAVPVVAGSLPVEKALPDLQLPPDESYQKTVLWFSFVGGLLVAGLSIVLFFRAVARERLTLSILLLIGPLSGFVVGALWGFGTACLLAPREFYETPRGRAWLRRIGTVHPLVARLACLVLVGLIGVVLLVVSLVVWLL
jgi:hypothetical protein